MCYNTVLMSYMICLQAAKQKKNLKKNPKLSYSLFIFLDLCPGKQTIFFVRPNLTKLSWLVAMGMAQIERISIYFICSPWSRNLTQ